MAMGHRTGLGTSLSTRVDPKLIQSSKMLEMNSAQLESWIESELNENPALERHELGGNEISDEDILRSVAPQELKPSSSEWELWRSMPTGSQDDLHWLDLAVSVDSLADHLRGQLQAALPVQLWPAAEFAVSSLNERGYLETSPEEIALSTAISLEAAEVVIEELRACEPAGIGASNLQDCLLLQLRNPDTVEQELAARIVRDRFDDLVQRNIRSLARAFRALPEVIEAALAHIATLNPFPGENFVTHPYGQSHSGRAIQPDITFTRDESGWTIEVRGADPIHFSVSRAYQIRHGELAGRRNVDASERRHIQEYVERAEGFIECLGQRKATLGKIGQILAIEQAGFLNTGEVKFLQPMTRSRLAEKIGIHESAMSRAVANKFIQLANGEVVPFDMFFNPALRIQKAIQEILATENPHQRLSDERIAEILAEQGIVIARRTVNKYRDRSRLLSSRRRKSA